MAPFTLTPVEKGIMRCRHAGVFTPDEVVSLAVFLRDYRGKLLIDITDANMEQCVIHIRQLRPMMPISAIVGAILPPGTLEIDQSYYAHDVRNFVNETDALDWLRNQ